MGKISRKVKNLRHAEKLKYGEIGMSLFMAVLSITFYVFATFKQNVNPTDPGPAFFPRLVSVLLFLLSFGQIVSSVYALKNGKLAQESEKLSEEPKKKVEGDYAVLYVLVTIGLTILYVIVFPMANYIITTALFIGVLMFAIGVRKWLLLSAVAVIYPIVMFLLFTHVLLIQLP